jgi:hypothetical protein
MISKTKATAGPEQGGVEQVCQCGRATTADSRFCRFCGRALREKSLCRTLSLCSEYTFGLLSHGHRKGQEESGRRAGRDFDVVRVTPGL